jgi:transcriptional regulator GlxA family with amidase domain
LNLETLSAPISGVVESMRAAAEQPHSFYTPREVAEILKVSTDTVLRKFSTVPGVIDLGSPENNRKRQYRTLRIPYEVLERFIIESRVV